MSILYAPCNQLGYGQIAYNILQHTGKLSYVPIGQPQLINDKIKSAINRLSIEDRNTPCCKVWHQHSLFERIGNGKYFGWSVFELDTFSPQEQLSLAFPDELIVCSQWAKEVIENNHIKTGAVHVVPLGVDTDIFFPRKLESDNTYKFLSIGKWEVRKSHDLLVDIFNKSFTTEDNVELWMLCHNLFYTKEENNAWNRMYLDSPLGRTGKIKIIPPLATSTDVALLISRCDCGISISRAEGWDLPALQTLACGKPLIATNYSAHTEFCTKDNSYLIEPTEFELAYDGGKWFGGKCGNWMKFGQPQIDQTVEFMRQAYCQGPIINEAGLKTAENFTWKKTTETLLQILEK